MQTVELCDKQLEVHMCIEKIRVMIDDLYDFFSRDLICDKKTAAMLLYGRLDTIRTKLEITTDYICEAEDLNDNLEELLSQVHCKQNDLS